jgi:diacylglycerol kinase family enzyme
MRMQVIINDRAGTVVGAGADAVLDVVVQELEAAGHDVDASIIKPEQLEAELARARREQPDALIVGGGDGTVRFAATAILNTQTALGVIPLGTINRLARDLGMPFDWRAAAQVLARGDTIVIDAAEVNGRLFLCNAVLGLTTRFSKVRQRLRGKPTMDRLIGYARAARHLLAAHRRTTIHIDDGIERRKLRVLSLVVTNNAYAEEASLTMHRPALDGGALAAYASRHESGWKMARAGIRALFGKITGDPDVVRVKATKLTIDVRKRRRVPLSIDGEIEKLTTPLTFVIRPKALRVLVPSATE